MALWSGTSPRPKPFFLAIVGTRNLEDNEDAWNEVRDAIERWAPVDAVISGGARGVDDMAEHWAKLLGIFPLIYRPQVKSWNDRGKLRGYRSRNIMIAKACDALVRIAAKDTTSFGSKWTLNFAKRLGRITEEIIIDG